MPLNDNSGRQSGVPAGGYQSGTASGPNIPQGARSTGAGTYTRAGVQNIEVVDPLLEGYVFSAGLEDPAISKYLSIKYPQYTLTTLLDRLGRSEGIANSSWSWFEMDRTRRGGVAKALQVSIATTTAPTLGGTLASICIVTDVPFGDPYFVKGDVIRLASGINVRVNEVGSGTVSSVAYQAIEVTRQDGGFFTTGTIATDISFGHVFNSWGEGSNGPGMGRAYFPEERYNKLNILRRSLKVTGNTLTQRTRVGDGKSWYYTVEDIEMKEFARYRELAILTGQMTPDGAAIQNGDGILSMVENQGTVTTFTGAMTEAALQSHILSMMYKFGSSAKEYVCLCGMDFMADVTNALKHYFIGTPNSLNAAGGSTSGGVSYGTFGNVNTVGLDLVSYRYMGKTIHFVHYEMFDDPAVFPFRNPSTSTATANRKSYSGSGLFLDMGSDSAGNKLVTMKHRELNGENRKFIHKIIPGMHQGSNGLAANAFDGFQIEYLSEVGVEIRVPGRHGFMTRLGS